MLLLGDVWSEGRLHTCIKSEAFKVHQILCLSVNEPCRSSAIKLALLRVVGVTGRTGTANLLLRGQGAPGLRSTKHLGKMECRNNSPGLRDGQESWTSPKFSIIFPRQHFWVSFHGGLAGCSAQSVLAGLMVLRTCEAVAHLPNSSWASRGRRFLILWDNICWGSWGLSSYFSEWRLGWLSSAWEFVFLSRA